MSAADPCRQCRRTSPGSPLDHRGWCGACRTRVAARAQWGGWCGAAAAALLYVGGTVALRLPVERWIVAWTAVGALLCFVFFKLARRIAFEVIQARTAPPRTEHPHD